MHLKTYDIPVYLFALILMHILFLPIYVLFVTNKKFSSNYGGGPNNSVQSPGILCMYSIDFIWSNSAGRSFTRCTLFFDDIGREMPNFDKYKKSQCFQKSYVGSLRQIMQWMTADISWYTFQTVVAKLCFKGWNSFTEGLGKFLKLPCDKILLLMSSISS